MDKIKEVVLDPSLEKYYASGREKDRLIDNPLEKDRTLMILKKYLPSPPAVILDIGGAAGAYSFPLAEQGYEVHLLDPVALHIEQAKEYEKTSSIELASCSIGDARNLCYQDASADAILSFGPLYNLPREEDRIKSLKEAYRVLKTGGILLAAGISRFAPFLYSLNEGIFHQRKDVTERELATGIHHKVSQGFDFGFIHKPAELKKELEQAGFEDVVVLGVEGPLWEKYAIDKIYKNPATWQSFLCLLEKIEREEAIVGASAHIMAIGKKV